VRFEAWKDGIIGQVHFGEHRPTWDEALLKYVQDVMPEQVKASTAERYLTSFRQIHHMLTGLYLDQIGKRELFEVVSRKGPKNATKRRDFTAVASVLGAAASWGWLDANPALTLDLKKVVRERRDPIVLPEHHEIQWLIDNCPSDMLSRMVKVLGLTGMRLSEASTVEWKEVSIPRRAIQLLTRASNR
jgi:integrase